MGYCVMYGEVLPFSSSDGLWMLLGIGSHCANFKPEYNTETRTSLKEFFPEDE